MSNMKYTQYIAYSLLWVQLLTFSSLQGATENSPPELKPVTTKPLSMIAADDTKTPPQPSGDGQSILINFNNVSFIEYIRFVSRLSNRNFIFDENDLNFNVTIVSEEPATIEDIMSALLQELRIHGLVMFEEGNNLIIHRNPKVNAISTFLGDETENYGDIKAEIVTQVFRLNTLDPEKTAAIIRPLVSEQSLIEILKDTNSLIITDITANVSKISQLLKNIDGPNSGFVIGQYVSRLTDIEVLIPLAEKIMLPISLDQPLTFVPQASTNSIFIVSNPFLVERTISILQYLDQDRGATRILNLKDLKMQKEGVLPGWMRDENQRWLFQPGVTSEQAAEQQRLLDEGRSSAPPKGTWSRDYNGNWKFTPGNGEQVGPVPKGHWRLDKDGNWVYEFDPNENFGNEEALTRGFQGAPRLPGGAEKKAQFFIYKLMFRKGVSLEPIIQQLADTIQQNEKGNEDLIATLRSVQWLQAANSLSFSGTPESLLMAAELVREIDKPMRQVFIEMLILETTLAESLEFGVNYATRFGGPSLAGAQSFASDTQNIFNNVIEQSGFNNLGNVIGNQAQLFPNPNAFVSSATGGANIGVIGQKITHCGTEFGSIAALIHALHDWTRDKVVSNPKMLIEDNTPAEIFVGLNVPYKTQSLSNGIGNVITSNFEYRDIGTRLRVTPYIGNGDVIALEIQEEVSNIVGDLITAATNANTSPGPTTSINRTTTRVHIPNGFFLVISGLMQNEAIRRRNQFPCLGGVPVLGAAFSDKRNQDKQRNLMIFMRPLIIDTEEEIDEVTRRQQNIYDYKNCPQNPDEYETKEALDLFNLKKTLHPEDTYECECLQ